MIYVYHKGEKNCVPRFTLSVPLFSQPVLHTCAFLVSRCSEPSKVGWYSDMQAVDIKEAILCACDAIMDGGFVLREVQLAGAENFWTTSSNNIPSWEVDVLIFFPRYFHVDVRNTISYDIYIYIFFFQWSRLFMTYFVLLVGSLAML